MSTHNVSRTLPYSCEQLFDIAADVESYPKYLPGWINARVLERTGNNLRVEQQLGLKIFTRPFITTAVLDRPKKVSIHSDDAPFRCLQIEWCFEPAGPGQCKVSLGLTYQMRAGLFERMAAVLFKQSSPEIIKRFARRAQTLYGG